MPVNYFYMIFVANDEVKSMVEAELEKAKLDSCIRVNVNQYMFLSGS